MAKSKRGRKGKRGGGSGAVAKKSVPYAFGSSRATNATSIGGSALSSASRVHPTTNDCYPLNKLCRLCLLSNTNMEPIFPYPGDKRMAEKIYQCTNLEIKETSDHGIPTSICGQCKKQLDQCYEFRLLCWKNDEILHNLHAILSPRKIMPRHPAVNSNLMVQVEKLDLSPNLKKHKEIDLRKVTPFTTPQRANRFSIWNVGQRGNRSMEQLYTPSRRGHKAAKNYPQFSKELVVRLTPISKTLINKYKKSHVTQTKASVKSFSPPPKSRGRPKGSVTKPVLKAKVAKKEKKPKVEKKIAKQKPVKVSQPAAAKKQKTKRDEKSMPPKKRKENFHPTPVTVTCSLCSQTFTSEKNLSRHTAAHENDLLIGILSRGKNRVFNCDLCRKEYLKASHLTDHLRSAEHIANAGPNASDSAEISILPDESGGELSILPDDTDEHEQPSAHNVTGESVESSQDAPEQTVDADDDDDDVVEITDRVDPPQPSPDTNDATQKSTHDVSTESAPPEEIRDASPIPVGDESSHEEDGVQYSDVCSTNNAENQYNGNNGNGTDSFNASRRVTFSDITEIVD